jgi:hypothetical protein
MSSDANDRTAFQDLPLAVGTLDFRDGHLFRMTSPAIQGPCVLEEDLRLASRAANVKWQA